ncbi:MAG: DUF3341 domain-containing protein [Myxococcota bacterium]|nr:DUF3341 domain-containing protein [Myxococcota bacterium]
MAKTKIWGAVAQFENPAELVHGVETIRGAGYKKIEAYSPFPIHGMEKVLGLGGSKVPWITLVGGLCGFTLATWLQWWTGSVDYPVVIGGKPLFAVESSVPIMFELTVLLSAFGTLAGMMILNGLPRPHHPLDGYAPFRRVTDDKFFISIESDDPKFDALAVQAALEQAGGTNVALVEE